MQATQTNLQDSWTPNGVGPTQVELFDANESHLCEKNFFRNSSWKNWINPTEGVLILDKTNDVEEAHLKRQMRI